MHAIVVMAQIDGTQDAEDGRKNLEEDVAPVVRQAPGFVSALWLQPNAEGEALSVVVFDSEQAANGGAGMARQMFEGGQVPPEVTLRSIEVREVAERA